MAEPLARYAVRFCICPLGDVIVGLPKCFLVRYMPLPQGPATLS